MKVWVTEFTDEKASAFRSEPQEMLWRGFVAALQERQPTANSKAGLPYLKLAKFSGEKSARNCLRYDRAVEVVSGVEIDYDAGELSIEEAALRLNKVGVEGVLQQSPSGTDTVHKWHGFFPLEEPLSSERHSTEWLKNRRRELSSALEQCLGVKLDGASHGLSHSFIFGNTGETRKTIATAGECVDAKFPSGHDRVPDSGLKRAGTSSDPAGIADLLPPVDPAEFAKALWSIPCAALSYDEWVKAGMACHHAERHCTAPMEGLDLWRSWSATDPERFKGGICEEKWPSFYGAAPPTKPCSG